MPGLYLDIASKECFTQAFKVEVEASPPGTLKTCGPNRLALTRTTQSSEEKPNLIFSSVNAHISSIYSSFPGKVEELQPRGKYQLSLFAVRANLRFAAVITLPPNFPMVPPVVSVEPALSHPWVDGKMDIYGHPQLNKWTGSVLIGKILKDVEMEFSLRPPQILHQNVPIPAHPPSPNHHMASSTSPHPSPITQASTVLFPEIDIKTYELSFR